MRGLKDKVVIVVAGSRGIGRAASLRFGREGARVVVGYASNEDAAQAVVSEIAEAGGEGQAMQIRVTDRGEVEAAFARTEERFGRPHIVVNAAGTSVFGPFAETEPDAVRNALDVNGLGAFHVLSIAATRLSEGGAIIHLSTGGTKMPTPGGGVYAGSKAAGEQMALGLAKELGERGIRVNVVSPGATDTDGLVMPQDQVDALVAQTPLGRLGKPGDVGDAIVFLASDDARWVNGQNIGINGGIL